MENIRFQKPKYESIRSKDLNYFMVAISKYSLPSPHPFKNSFICVYVKILVEEFNAHYSNTSLFFFLKVGGTWPLKVVRKKSYFAKYKYNIDIILTHQKKYIYKLTSPSGERCFFLK